MGGSVGDNRRIKNKMYLSDISMGEDIRTWRYFKDKRTYKDVPVLIVCISSLPGYFFHLF